MIEVEIDIETTPQNVWAVLTQEEHMRTWWGKDIHFEKHFGGKFYGHWHESRNQTHGKITHLEDGALLQMSWQDDGWLEPTRVEFILIPISKGTRLCLHHSGWGIFHDQKRSEIVGAYKKRWQETLEQLKNICLKN